MAGGRCSSDQLAIADRRESAVTLRRQGYSYRAIGEALGISQTQAHHDVESVLLEIRDRTAAEAETLRVLEGERLDEIYQSLLPRVLTGDMKAVQQIHRNIELRMRLYGLESSKKIEVTNRLQEDMSNLVATLRALMPHELFEEMIRYLEAATAKAELPITVEAIASKESEHEQFS